MVMKEGLQIDCNTEIFRKGRFRTESSSVVHVKIVRNRKAKSSHKRYGNSRLLSRELIRARDTTVNGIFALPCTGVSVRIILPLLRREQPTARHQLSSTSISTTVAISRDQDRLL